MISRSGGLRTKLARGGAPRGWMGGSAVVDAPVSRQLGAQPGGQLLGGILADQSQRHAGDRRRRVDEADRGLEEEWGDEHRRG